MLFQSLMEGWYQAVYNLKTRNNKNYGKTCCLADSYTKVAKISSFTCNINFLHHADFWRGVRNYYFEDQKSKGHMKLWFRKLCMWIVWNIDDYQKNCSFSIFDTFGGCATKSLITMRPDALINNLRTKTWGRKDQLKNCFKVFCKLLFTSFFYFLRGARKKVRN